MSYTPGPWKLEPAYYVGHDEGETQILAYFPEFDRWCKIASCFDENAVLIRSTPELYEALRYIVVSLENNVEITKEDVASLREVLRVAEGK